MLQEWFWEMEERLVFCVVDDVTNDGVLFRLWWNLFFSVSHSRSLSQRVKESVFVRPSSFYFCHPVS